MHLSWLGQTCVKLQTKNMDEDVTILIDAYKPAKGDFPRSFSPTVALFSHGQENAATLSQNPFVLDTLGECEIKNVMITAWPTNAENIVYKINAEGLALVHLGRMHKKAELSELEKIGNIDILFIPVGNGSAYLSAEDAADLTTALEPRIVIPIAYQCDTDPAAKPVSEFTKELGLKPEVTDKKIIIKKKDLPQEETKLFILEKSI
ncbi:MAG TPA: MBL fold metallo-hydrolase [Patescibacteria group bacterium]|nr:MBL fold metallo-hydrolase [Patescibacteria group bacterium]